MKGLSNCKTYIEGRGWVYNFEIMMENKALQANLKPQKPLDVLFNERWGKQATVWQNKPLVWSTRTATREDDYRLKYN